MNTTKAPRHTPNVVRTEAELVIHRLGGFHVRWANRHDTSPVILSTVGRGGEELLPEPGPLRGNWPTPATAVAFLIPRLTDEQLAEIMDREEEFDDATRDLAEREVELREFDASDPWAPQNHHD